MIKSIQIVALEACRYFFVMLVSVIAVHVCTNQVQAAQLYHHTAPLLHTFVEIKAYGDNRTQKIIDETFIEMARVNDLLNNYDTASDISAINTAAGKKPVPINSETFHALLDAKKYARISKGSFDFTVGPLITLWDFDREPPGRSAPDPGNRVIDKIRTLVDYRALLLEQGPDGPTAMLKLKDMRIDTGAFGKGYAADKAIVFLKKNGITNALVSAGGTIHAIGVKTENLPWQIGIRHPRNNGSFLTIIPLYDQSVSTSGDYEKFYYKGGKRRSHIIDPRTGFPMSTMQSVTVIAPSSIASDALSTALFVLGPVDGLKLIERYPGHEALVVTAEGEVRYSSGWPQKKIVY